MGYIKPLIGLVSSTWKYGKRAANLIPELVCGSGSEVLAKGLKNANGSPLTKLNTGFVELEKYVKAQKGGFWERAWNNIKSLKDIGKNAKAAEEAFIQKASNPEKAKVLERLLKIKNTSSESLGKKVYRKTILKELGKRVPLFGGGILLLTEIPNIWSATTEQGLFSGGKEVVKTTARLTGAMVGSAIGQVLIPIPFVGGIVGWCVGESLTSKIVGESYTAQKDEEQEKLAKQAEQLQLLQQQAYAQNQQPNAAPTAVPNVSYPQNAYNQQLNAFAQNPYLAYQMQNSIPYQNDIFMQKMPFNRIA